LIKINPFHNIAWTIYVVIFYDTSNIHEHVNINKSQHIKSCKHNLKNIKLKINKFQQLKGNKKKKKIFVINSGVNGYKREMMNRVSTMKHYPIINFFIVQRFLH
jgi:indole-3-glycerol phosphate synthase